MLLAHPHVGGIVHGLGDLPLGHSGYVYLLAANVGAVVMPWMIFYQQSAVVAKGLRPEHLPQARRDTAVGAVLTQAIMIVVVVTLAATVFVHDPRASLNTVGDIAHRLQPFIGGSQADVFVGAAVLGGALVAALVVSLAGSWGLAEVLGWRHSLNERVSRDNAKFFVTYSGVHILGAVLVLASVDLVSLAVDVEVMNSLLLPLVLGMLLALEHKALPPEYRMRGAYRGVVTTACLIVMAFGLYMIPVTLGL
jgi:Mn2+/Fe2+ NRAMP family transporter